jgi:hypothetical protein
MPRPKPGALPLGDAPLRFHVFKYSRLSPRTVNIFLNYFEGIEIEASEPEDFPGVRGFSGFALLFLHVTFRRRSSQMTCRELAKHSVRFEESSA